MEFSTGKAAGDEKGTVISVSLLTAVCLLGDSMLYVTLPIFFKQAGLSSLWEVGLLLSVNRLVRLPLNPVIGWIYHKMSWKTGMWVALFLSIISTVGYGCFQGLAAWLILRVIWGCAWSLLRIGGMIAVVSVANENNHGEGMGWYNGLYRLGSLGGMLVGTILAVKIGFSMTAILLGVMPVLFIPFVIKMRGVSPERTEQTQKQAKISFHVNRMEMLVFVTGFMVSFYIQGVITSTFSSLITSRFPGQVDIASFLIPSTVLAGFILGIRWVWEPFLAVSIGRWSDRHGRVPIFIFSLLLFGAGMGLVPAGLNAGAWAALILVLLILSTVLTTLADSLLSVVAKQRSISQTTTLYALAADLGAALGPQWGLGLLGVDGGIWIVYLSGTVACFIFAFLWLKRWRAVGGES
ncbi:MFS transporter [Paenactinomyces guangxiensis]|uniref:MFS transporter n=1 Tax=Paenactinomyces guangxiensis TaxID=1490290 RepID=A0A7W1WPE8_9BACL|nr:MFS transporter [Paenactinomyces guangxiensis]MBA4493632.1 MFS transporter [Paenactinomyces guangxiensis]MBH8590919.1 MFS transporter [Paenactinomyces guangxiensis]